MGHVTITTPSWTICPRCAGCVFYNSSTHLMHVSGKLWAANWTAAATGISLFYHTFLVCSKFIRSVQCADNCHVSCMSPFLPHVIVSLGLFSVTSWAKRKNYYYWQHLCVLWLNWGTFISAPVGREVRFQGGMNWAEYRGIFRMS